jgi:two-component sensor histidine kinase
MFNLLCITYSLPFIIFSFWFKFYQSATVFLVGLIFYLISHRCIQQLHLGTAKVLILVATGLSVFYLSLLYGFASGFHLYYFTSPLIVFSIFDFTEKRKIFFGFLLHLSCIITLIWLNSGDLIMLSNVPYEINKVLYPINIVLALSFCLLLVAFFSEFNNKANEQLSISNKDLEVKHQLLLTEINERRETESKLHVLLKDKETLLSETHHRVKNNLAVVSGMLDLQAMMNEDERIKEILNDSRSRIKSMSLIHEALYKYENVSHIEFGKYIDTLLQEIQKTYQAAAFTVKISIEAEKIFLNVIQAIPCGLLVNEVITNCYKHAFLKQTHCEINIKFYEEGKNCVLMITDNGKGINRDVDLYSKSIGMTLIDAFVKQLKGNHQIINDNGTKLVLTFEHSL